MLRQEILRRKAVNKFELRCSKMGCSRPKQTTEAFCPACKKEVMLNNKKLLKTLRGDQ